jgi:starvation-inducible outer membrane lipoprotein
MNIRSRLQKLRDLQDKKHQKYLETKLKAEKYHQDSIRLGRKVVDTQEQLMSNR